MARSNEMGVIVLGGEEFPIRAFTLDELQEAIPAIGAYYGVMGAEGNSPAVITAAKGVLALALRKPVEEVGKIAATVDEVWLAVAKISEVAGLTSLGERLKAMMTPPTSIGTASTPTL